MKGKKERAEPRKKLKRMLVHLLTSLMIFSVVFTESYSSEALDKTGGQAQGSLGVLAEPKLEDEASIEAFNLESLKVVTTDNSMGKETEEITIEPGTEEQSEADTLPTESPKENPPAKEEVEEELSKENPEETEDKIADDAEGASEEQQMINPMAAGDIVTTADTSGFLNINLFDYRTNDNEDSGDVGINQGHALKFSTGQAYQGFNRWTGNANVYPGILQRLLDNSYPRLNSSVTGSNESLAYLFNTATIQNAKTPYLGMNRLFLYDSNSRYYSFDSTKYFAQANTSNKNFTVYEDTRSKGFFPFDSYTRMAGLNITPGDLHTYDINGNKTTTKSLYLVPSKTANHYFGLHVSGHFVQPVNGKITKTNGVSEDMIFHFSGDDDLWVYIDGALTLDIGGIHDASSGYINFATGAVVVFNNGGDSITRTNIKTLFEAATGRQFNGNGQTFRDNTLHSIDVFYLERGNSASNLRIQFNLDLIKTGDIIIGKELEAEEGVSLNESAAVNRDYTFTMFKKSGGGSGAGVSQANTPYILRTASGADINKITDSSGRFTLKPGEYARFSGMETYMNYYVVESGISSLDYKRVSFSLNDGTPVTKEIDQGSGTARSDDFQLTNDVAVIHLLCTNVVSKDNLMSLEIIKKLKTDTPEEAKTAEYAYGNNSFQIEVMIEGSLYRNGTYSLYRTVDQGVTWTIVEGNHKTDNGGILTLKPNEKAVISGLIGGSSFKVREISGDDFDKFTPSYEITGGRNTSTNNGAEGSLNKASDLTGIKKVIVTVNNKPSSSSVAIKKIDSVTGLRLEGATFIIYGDEALTKELIRVVSEDGKSTIIPGLMIGKTYYMKEAKAPEGYLGSDRVYKIEIASKDSRTITPGQMTNGTWSASGDGTLLGANQEYTIENHRLSSIRLIKKDNNGGYLSGVTFRLEKLKDDGTLEGSYVDKITDTSGVVEFNNLLPGKYRITEIATVPGYILLTEPIEVMLPWSTQEAPEEGADILPYAQVQDKGKTTYYYDRVEYIITNSPNFTVPTTGGSNYYYGGLGGLLLMALALGGLIYRKKALRSAR